MKKRKKTQITKIINESKTNINFTEIKSLIRERFKQWYIRKLDNLDELDKFLVIHKLPKLYSRRNRKSQQIYNKERD